jgi:hypothetical protein
MEGNFDYDVWLGGKVITQVHTNSPQPVEELKDMLIQRQGFDKSIIVRVAKPKENDNG